MASPATTFFDVAARSLREAELPDANFTNGGNMAGSCAVGIGINMLEGEVVGTPEQFTLLDVNDLPRNAQRSQSIGGYPYVPSEDYPSSGGQEGTLPDAVIGFGDSPTQPAKDANPELDGTIIITEASSLIDLAVGWEAFTP